MKEAVVALIRRQDGRVLCVWNKRFSGWCLPGGKVERDESRFDALVREVMEETGRDVATAAPIYSAWGTIDPSVRVFVYEVTLAASYLNDLQSEPDCPCGWLSEEAMVYESNPFASFYVEFFDRLKSGQLAG